MLKLIALLLLSAFQVRVPGPGGSGSAAVAYYCRQLSTPAGGYSETNFTATFSGTYSWLATVANGGKVQNANGYDVRFYPSADCSGTKLSHTTEMYTAATGAVAYHVKVGTFSSASAISIRYGESGVTTDQSDTTNAWDANYEAVYLLSDLTDATGSFGALDPTWGGTITSTTGQVGNAYDYVSGVHKTPSNVLTATDNISLMFWARPTTTAGNQVVITTGASCGTYDGWYIYFGTSNTAVRVFTPTEWASGNTITTNQWDHWAFVRTGGTWQQYKNGSAAGSTDTDTPTTPNFYDVIGGCLANFEVFTGKIDDVRWGTNRSADWVDMVYRGGAQTLFTVGSEVAH